MTVSVEPLSSFEPTVRWPAERIVLDYVSRFEASKTRLNIPSDALDFGTQVAIVGSGVDLNALAKRGALFSKRLIIAHDERVAAGRGTPLPVQVENDGETVYETFTNILAPDLEDLSRWLRDASPLIRRGDLVYVPNIHQSEFNAGSHTYYYEDRPGFLWMLDVLRKHRSAIADSDMSILKATVGEAIMRIEVPCIEGVALRDFARIVEDHPESFSAIRSHLQRKLFDLYAQGDKRKLNSFIIKTSLDLEESLREARNDLKRLVRRSAVQAAGGVLATVSATLLALDLRELASILSVIGASGGAWGLLSGSATLLLDRTAVSDRPIYFLWLLEKSPH